MTPDERTVTIEALRMYHRRLGAFAAARRTLVADLIVKQLAKLTKQEGHVGQSRHDDSGPS